jgi:hypothetical protein
MTQKGRAALIIGHPGHELRVHRWLELAKPTVYVLTDGSGHTRRSRLRSTSTVLHAAGATPGTIYGSFSDADLYSAMLAGDRAVFCRVVHALADALVCSKVDDVVADALEGFNPSHDLCRYLVNAAVALAQYRQRLGPVRNFEFLLEGSPAACPEDLRADSVRLELTDDDLARKIAAARSYPELREETDAALARFGSAAFRTECLRPVRDVRQGLDSLDQEPPYYERYGEQQVAAGHYDRVIRYRAHIQPLVRALWHDVGLNGPHTTVTIASALTGTAM